jgi:hypothetical protein
MINYALYIYIYIYIYFEAQSMQDIYAEISRHYQLIIIQGDQKVFVHMMITIQSSGAQRLFDHPVQLVRPFLAGFQLQGPVYCTPVVVDS